MGIPQVVVIVWLTMAAVGSALLHGKEVKLNFYHNMMALATIVYFLEWGGFF